jgi:DNA processing protein
MSRYGKQVLATLLPQLVGAGYTTISGFMYGVDIEVHRLTWENGGKTIGVFGWGIDYKIDPENETLYHKFLESNGLFISEMEPTRGGTLWSFPQRNRIVVGLAEQVIVVEAGMKSGSLNSAQWARKLGKPVYAVPGSIFSSTSAGCNWLIAAGRAVPWTLETTEHATYSDKRRIKRTDPTLSEEERQILTQLTLEGPQGTNELARACRLPVAEVGAVLTTLVVKGEVVEERGVWQRK